MPKTISEKRKRANAIAAKLNRDKRFGPGTVVVASDVVPEPRRYTTGSLAFDVPMGGGFPVNQWTEILGLENAGKTAFVLKAIAANQALDPDFLVCWIASEAYDIKLATMCGVDNDRVILIEENIMELAYEAALEYIEDRAADFVVIDSYPALMTQAEADKSMEELTVGQGARITNQFMRKCTKAGKRSLIDSDDPPFTGVFINQWREKIGVMYGDPRTSSGGKGKNYWMYARLDISREYIKENQIAVGQAIKVVVMKMKGARPKQVGVTDFYFTDCELFNGGEYDELKAVSNMAMYFDVITRSSGNAGSYIIGERRWQSFDKMLVDLRSEPELRASVEAEVFAAAQRGGRVPVEPEPDEELLEDPTPPRPGSKRAKALGLEDNEPERPKGPRGRTRE